MKHSLTASRMALLCSMVAGAILTTGSAWCLAQDGGDAQPPATETPAAANLPKAEDVISDYVKALGGKEAIHSHTSRMMKGELEVGGQVVPVTLYAAAPNKMLIELDVPNHGLIKQGFNGEVAWNLDPVMGASVLPDEEVEKTRDQADFYAETRLEKRFESMKTVAKKPFDGVECYVLDMVDHEGNKSEYYFEVKSGLLRGNSQTQDTQMGPMEFTTVHKEYKEMGGVKSPVLTEISAGGMTRVMKFTEIELDKLNDETFALPAEVQEAIDAGKKAEGEEADEPEEEDEDR